MGKRVFVGGVISRMWVRSTAFAEKRGEQLETTQFSPGRFGISPTHQNDRRMANLDYSWDPGRPVSSKVEHYDCEHGFICRVFHLLLELKSISRFWD